MDCPVDVSSLPSSDSGSSKRQKLVPPSPRYVCVICSSLCTDPGDRRVFDLFIVDLTSGDESFEGAPTLRLDPGPGCFDNCAFCVLDSTLYMFDDCSWDMIGSGDWSTKISVNTLDLSRYLNGCSNLKLDRASLPKAPQMTHPKRVPAALPTPDGKRIVVFSTLIDFDPEYKTGDLINFEMYDSTARSWQKLPGICDGRMGAAFFSIRGWFFRTESVLFLDTKIGVFSLDIDSPDKGWKPGYLVGVARPHLPLHLHFPFSGRAFVFEGELLLSEFGAFDISEEDGFSTRFMPELSPPPFDYGDVTSTFDAITLLDDIYNGQCNFCFVQAGLNKDTRYPYLIIDECTFDVIKYKEHKEKAREDKNKVLETELMPEAETELMLETELLSAHINKSFKFLVNTHPFSNFFPLGVFSIPAGTN